MSLANFKDARPWARSIKQRVAGRQMPPWHIDRSVGVQRFKNDMSLTDKQIDTIVNWVDQGAPEGDPGNFAPKPVATGLYWQAERDGFGPPDLVVRAPMQTMPALHQDVVVAAGQRDSHHRATLGEGGRDPPGQHRRPQDPPPLDRVSHPQSGKRRGADVRRRPLQPVNADPPPTS